MRRTLQGWGTQFDHLADQVWAMMKELHKSKVFHVQSSPDWCPNVNLYETSESFMVCAELAGVNRDKIDVHVENRLLTISGFREKPQMPPAPDHVSVHLMEIDSGRFRREVPIPCDVDVDSIRANHREGYLWVVLPRSS